MDWIIFLIVGLLAGMIAKALMPGTRDEPSGWLLTIVLGIAGAYVGGFIGDAIGLASTGIIGSILMAALGAMVIIALMRLFTNSRRAI
jgi:uncharacterized membrane protein YeaQ/YmgE (transglycosylase-associated protein family)